MLVAGVSRRQESVRAVQSFNVDNRACVRVRSMTGLRYVLWLFSVYMDGVVSEVNASILGR